MWEVQENAPGWLMYQNDLTVNNQCIGAVNSEQAKHMCYAFAGVSVLNSFGNKNREEIITVQDFSARAGVPLGEGGVPYQTTKHYCKNSGTVINNSALMQTQDNPVCEDLKVNGSRRALISCKHKDNSELLHVFVMSYYENKWTIYNVWNRKKYVWTGNRNPMVAFPNVNGELKWKPESGQAYWGGLA